MYGIRSIGLETIHKESVQTGMENVQQYLVTNKAKDFTLISVVKLSEFIGAFSQSVDVKFVFFSYFGGY